MLAFRYIHRFCPVVAVAMSLAAAPAYAARTNTSSPVITGPQGTYPYAVSGVGRRTAIAPAPGDPSFSLFAHSRSDEPQKLRIVAFMVEFNEGQPDSNSATTGTGLFNIWETGTGTGSDVEE